MEKVYTVRMQEIIHYIAYELEAPDAALHLLGFKICCKCPFYGICGMFYHLS